MIIRKLAKLTFSLLVIFLVVGACPCEINLPPAWSSLTNTIADRMQDYQASAVVELLTNLQAPTPQLQKLQYRMPNSTVALLGAIQSQGLLLAKAEKIAGYLEVSSSKLSGHNLRNYDENTAQNIERDWRSFEQFAAL